MTQADPRLAGHLGQLAATHGFSMEALFANRAGQIHPEQRAAGGKKGVGCAVFLFIMGGLLLAGGIGGALAFYDTLHEPIQRVDMNAVYAIAIGGFVLALAATGGAIAMLRNVGKRRGAYQAGAIEVLEGPITKVCIQGSGGVADEFAYDVGGRRFRFVPKAGWDALLPGVRYRVYCVAGDLLSLEPS